ncbi:interferon regulatory factor 7 isoform X2 [Salarias fasciatus]|uniref:Interferon regulatory factor 3-like n=1 Tax=Salarias fasciatus TaxID=181472 RepID=A0A672F8N6_SALFA|nr:interferon regulatory factor 3-like isoform X2 [Salarias fasciatus]
MQSQQKPQFATWLIEQVGTGQYPGLHYVAQNKFRVPWKHLSRKDCNDEDSGIFRAWAIASGKINEFPNDKARWKTNFRCALNTLNQQFKMIEDNSKNSEDPHKIYEIINTRYNYETLPTQESQEDPALFLSPTTYFPSGSECDLLNNFMALDLDFQPTEQQPWIENYMQPDPVVVVGGYPAAAENHPQFLPQQPANYEAVAPGPVPSSPHQPSIYDLEISIHYRKKEMLKQTLSAVRLQLHYGCEVPGLNAHALCFPSPDGLIDHKQIDYTSRLLNSIQRGLLLEVKECGIYATRHDKCHVFASTSDPNVAHPQPAKLPQSIKVPLLDFKKFVHELKQFTEHSGRSPEYTINMCFGEKFPDGKPLEKKLIVVKVVPLLCRYLHEMAQMGGASSLHSANVSLQTSHNSLMDLISSVFGPPSAEEPPTSPTSNGIAHHIMMMQTM